MAPIYLFGNSLHHGFDDDQTERADMSLDKAVLIHPTGWRQIRRPSLRFLEMLAAVALLAVAAPQKGLAQMNVDQKSAAQPAQSHPYVGMWMTADGHIRHNLLANGRYDEARGNRESAYQGRYEVRGADIFYWDDTGFTADGKFIDGVLHHGGMIFHRAK
jgi:hypothetical protein